MTKYYHVKNQESYDGLMKVLSATGEVWADGSDPQDYNAFPTYGYGTVVEVHEDGSLTSANIGEVDRRDIIEWGDPGNKDRGKTCEHTLKQSAETYLEKVFDSYSGNALEGVTRADVELFKIVIS